MKNLASGENNFGDIHEEVYLLNLVLMLKSTEFFMLIHKCLSPFSQTGRKLRPLPRPLVDARA